mmetsp:Transcript_45211/g.144857  ORF Transcript_45211/g.144857 Transcript_45211/m.144857 type:complete len:240 (-) Transcript_45211:29-748(-)
MGPKSDSRASSHAVWPCASAARRSARASSNSLATLSWPCSHATCSGVLPPAPSSANPGSARARSSSRTMSSLPDDAASESPLAHARGGTKQLASSRRSFGRSFQQAALLIAITTSLQSSRPCGMHTAFRSNKGSSSASTSLADDAPPPALAAMTRARFRRSSPRPMRNSSWEQATCSGRTSCQNSCPRKRNLPGPSAPPRGTPSQAASMLPPSPRRLREQTPPQRMHPPPASGGCSRLD